MSKVWLEHVVFGSQLKAKATDSRLKSDELLRKTAAIVTVFFYSQFNLGVLTL